MPTLRKELLLQASPEDVWDAVRDFGAVDRRLATGFVAHSFLDGNARVVEFVNGLTVREPLVTCDDDARRLAYGSEGGRATHYNAVIEVVAEGDGHSRLIWTIDLLPAELAPVIDELQNQGCDAMRRTLDGSSPTRAPSAAV